MQAHRPIRAPGVRLGSHVGLSWNRPRGRRKPLTAGLTLTPLIDVFVVIVLFLLIRFTASGQCCPCSSGYELPVAERAERLSRAPVVAVGADGEVTLDGAEVARVHELLDDEIPDWKIYPLTEQLEVKRQSWMIVNPGQVFSGTVIIAADRSTDFRALKKILYSCGLAGYADVHLAVSLLRREE
jgi:biopolymer transport protein ExbD